MKKRLPRTESRPPLGRADREDRYRPRRADTRLIALLEGREGARMLGADDLGARMDNQSDAAEVAELVRCRGLAAA